MSNFDDESNSLIPLEEYNPTPIYDSIIHNN